MWFHQEHRLPRCSGDIHCSMDAASLLSGVQQPRIYLVRNPSQWSVIGLGAFCHIICIWIADQIKLDSDEGVRWKTWHRSVARLHASGKHACNKCDRILQCHVEIVLFLPGLFWRTPAEFCSANVTDCRSLMRVAQHCCHQGSDLAISCKVYSCGAGKGRKRLRKR